MPDDKVLVGYIKEAVRINDEGVKLPTRPKSNEKKELVISDDFLAAAKKKKALTAFENFSYSHKKEYIEWITEGKGNARKLESNG